MRNEEDKYKKFFALAMFGGSNLMSVGNVIKEIWYVACEKSVINGLIGATVALLLSDWLMQLKVSRKVCNEVNACLEIDSFWDGLYFDVNWNLNM